VPKRPLLSGLLPPGRRPRPRDSSTVRRQGSPSQQVAATPVSRQNIISLARLLGCPVLNQAGQEVARLADLVANVQASDTYPAVTGCLLQIGQQHAFLDSPAISRVEQDSVILRTAHIDVRGFQHGEGQVLLARDILHHQLVTTGDVHVIRAADLYLTQASDQVRLTGAAAGRPPQVPRFGRGRWRKQPSPGQVIDWAEIEWLGASAGEPAAMRLRSPHPALRRLRPAELADVLEELATPAQREVLASLDRQVAADALEEMEPHQLTALLRELPPAEAAALISGMEPDEAADALRDLPAAEQSALLARMPPDTQRELAALLGYPANQAGGLMTTVLTRASPEQTVAQVRDALTAQAEHHTDIDAIAVLDASGRLVADVPVFDLLASDNQTPLGDLIDPGNPPITLRADTSLNAVATELLESRRRSLLVVDDDGRPLGRILIDDVLDALSPSRRRHHFPRRRP